MTIDELRNELKSFFDRTHTYNAFMLYLKSHENVKNELQKMLDNEPWFENLFRCGYCVYKGVTAKTHCPVCGKEIKAERASKGHVYCSAKCSNNSDETRQKKLATTRLRYGTDYAIQSEAGKEKLRQTNMERFGCAYSMQNQEVKEKMRKTNLERYGSECSLKNSEVREKAKKTNLERYGTEYVVQSGQVRDKIKK